MTRSYSYRGLSRSDLRDGIERRLLAKVRHERGHWIWTASVTRGHPNIGIGPGIATTTVRVSWVLWRGDLNAGDVVTQTCGRLLCVNPEHLRRETTPESRTRYGRGRRRLSDRQVAAIRASARRHTAAELADRYDVSINVIVGVARNRPGSTYYDPSCQPTSCRNPRIKVTPELAETIYRRYETEAMVDIAEDLGLALSTIWMACHPEVQRTMVDGRRFFVRTG